MLNSQQVIFGLDNDWAPWITNTLQKIVLHKWYVLLSTVLWACRLATIVGAQSVSASPLRWRHNGGASVSNHQPHECLLNRLIRCRSKETSKLRVAGLCVGNSPGTGEFPAQMARNAENVPIWWRHHASLARVYWIYGSRSSNELQSLDLEIGQ